MQRKLGEALTPGRKDLERLAAALEEGADPRRPLVAAGDHGGRLALNVVCEDGWLEAARLVIEAGADVDAADRTRRSPLHLAVSAWALRSTEMIEFLLARGASASAEVNFTHRETVLHALARSLERSLAARNKRHYKSAVMLLLAAGADPRARDEYGFAAHNYSLRARPFAAVSKILNGAAALSPEGDVITATATAQTDYHEGGDDAARRGRLATMRGAFDKALRGEGLPRVCWDADRNTGLVGLTAREAEAAEELARALSGRMTEKAGGHRRSVEIGWVRRTKG